MVTSSRSTIQLIFVLTTAIVLICPSSSYIIRREAWLAPHSTTKQAPWVPHKSFFDTLLRQHMRPPSIYRYPTGKSLVKTPGILFKRLGIAGLNNMDLITSSLDRAQKQQTKSRHRYPMSMSISMNDLRGLMEAGRRR